MKIGITTLFHENYNYGGMFQSYALCKVISGFGYHTEQICYTYRDALKEGKIKRFLSCPLKTKISKVRYKLYSRFFLRKKISLRNKAFTEFIELIPHTCTYDETTIKECNEQFDCFVTGSDQVWNPKFMGNKAFFLLDFVENNKPKFSYAASIGHVDLSEQHKRMFKEYLADFIGVSVRESDAVDLIRQLSPVEPEWVLDPVLLFDSTGWDMVCADRIIKEKFIFCYFCGADKELRILAEKFASERNLKVVSITGLSNTYCSYDRKFGDERLWKVSPQEFISLVKNAEYVFSDSFHASVLSAIYNKEFYVFNRSDAKMASRLYSLTSLFECPEHFCDTKDKMHISYVNQLDRIDYKLSEHKIKKLRAESLAYLERNLKRAEEIINEK